MQTSTTRRARSTAAASTSSTRDSGRSTGCRTSAAGRRWWRRYFHQRLEFDEPGTYADLGATTEHNRTEEWQHPLGDVVSAVIGAGLTLEFLHEHDYTLFPRWPFLEKSGPGIYRVPEGRPRLPLMYSLRARAG
jgi:hypothetical protein